MTFYISSNLTRTRDLTTRFPQDFCALSPVADKIGSKPANLFKIPDVGVLSDLNISLNQLIDEKSGDAPSKLVVIDLLSDMLLRNRALVRRRWLSDFISRHEASGFTTLDPSIASKEEVQSLV